MFIESEHIREYIKANPLEHTVFVIERYKGVKLELTLDHHEQLATKETHGCTGIYFANEDGTIYYTVAGHECKLQVTLPMETLQVIKEWVLQRKATEEIKGIFNSAKAMVEHNHRLAEQQHTTADEVGRLYVLRDINFYQDAKYHILFMPYTYRGKDEFSSTTMKGYVFSGYSGETRFETVQCWRYQVIKPDNPDPIVQKIWSELSDEWKNLLGY